MSSIETKEMKKTIKKVINKKNPKNLIIFLDD